MLFEVVGVRRRDKKRFLKSSACADEVKNDFWDCREVATGQKNMPDLQKISWDCFFV
jgi:hypothetical protein